MPDLEELLAVFAGGCVGALGRAGLAEALPHHAGRWPWATFAVNIAGAALLGWAITRHDERLPPSLLSRPFVGTGFCGALTTFSTLQVELLRMPAGLAGAYAAASLAAGFAAVVLATGLARR